LGFMVPDLLHVFIPWQELKEMAWRRGVPPSHLIKNEDFVAAVVMVALMWLFTILVQ
jgi:hypothetical protein